MSSKHAKMSRRILIRPRTCGVHSPEAPLLPARPSLSSIGG
jgi:hypothetical protein